MKILALHGFSGSGADFDPLAAALGVDIQTQDLLGHGEADAPLSEEAYRIGAVAQRVAKNHDGEPVVLLGYSMGGRVALRLWPALGSALGGLILVSTSPGLEDPVERTERIATDTALAAQIESKGIDWFCGHWADRPIIRSQRNIAPEILQAMTTRRSRNRPHGLSNSLRGMGVGAANPAWAELGDIGVPTLLLTGAADPRYGLIADEMAERIPSSQHITVAGAGHCVHLEQVQAVATIIDGFVASLSG